VADGSISSHYSVSTTLDREGTMASKDKGTKANKKPAKKNLKEKRAEKKAKKSK
jgi:hypothetical protein